jgi:hypothetical protein
MGNGAGWTSVRAPASSAFAEPSAVALRGGRTHGHGDPERRCLWILVLPDPNNSPTSGRERSVVASVSIEVAAQLGLPVGGVRRWQDAVLRAPVPEAAIHEHCDALTGKHEIGATPQTRQRRDMLAKPKAESVHRRSHGYLRASVPRAVSLHDAPDR